MPINHLNSRGRPNAQRPTVTLVRPRYTSEDVHRGPVGGARTGHPQACAFSQRVRGSAAWSDFGLVKTPSVRAFPVAREFRDCRVAEPDDWTEHDWRRRRFSRAVSASLVAAGRFFGSAADGRLRRSQN
jgi:hypothetical protein